MKSIAEIELKKVNVEKTEKKFVFKNMEKKYTLAATAGLIAEAYGSPKLMVFLEEPEIEVIKLLEAMIPTTEAKFISTIKTDDAYKMPFMRINIKKASIITDDDVLDGTASISALQSIMSFKKIYIIFNAPQVWDMTGKDDFHGCGLFFTPQTIIVKGKDDVSKFMTMRNDVNVPEKKRKASEVEGEKVIEEEKKTNKTKKIK